ncbi:MAG: bifunctional 2-C-methyl-D-erythritol 4-phosphate cytidylyltransferase/2-C-methyl-D-erythritol 2,4-cyclodiphosphate synthase [Minwuia sp.]|nr:bifunctional 2-C-methyl-D-erythritol 4-phosphate cytidylyltransferase/2-C-methyl-D-erythritol 2,4-cyclodiphosphate synthase [Minwuia sp.]
MRTAALIVAAGRGTRLGADTPKQYLDLLGKPVLRRTIEAFLLHDEIDLVQSVIGAEHDDLYFDATQGLDLPAPVTGGDTRQQSVARGLAALKDQGIDRVLIHDGARALVDATLITRVCHALDDHPAVLPAVPVVDSLRRVTGDRVEGLVDRSGLVRAQTPQGFHFMTILSAHEQATGPDLSDDVAVAAAAGVPVVTVPGSDDNFKITVMDDLRRAEDILTRNTGGPMETRTGSGFDVHRLVPGRPLMLCGLPIEHSHGLAGHSDADVALHALTDAILGAIAEGDIGDHFPPTDDRWRGVSSDIFLRYAVGLVRLRSGHVTSVDLTIICEAPKIRPHRDAMRQRVADILETSTNRVSIKATTTEQLGFTGRAEGIAAQAIATVALPAEPVTLDVR